MIICQMQRKHNDKPIREYSCSKCVKGAQIFEYNFKQSKALRPCLSEEKNCKLGKSCTKYLVSYCFLLLKGYILESEWKTLWDLGKNVSHFFFKL